MGRRYYLVTAEHAGNMIPENFAQFFRGQVCRQRLLSHEGWDPGSAEVASVISEKLKAPLISQPVSRLLIEMNRSLGNPELFSAISREFCPKLKTELIEKYYRPYREKVIAHIENGLRSNDQVIHLSIHTFAEIWNGAKRKTDIGLLFDPERPSEKALCSSLIKSMESTLPQMFIEFNKPYLGIDDGLTTYLRTVYPDSHYAGIEIEINQKFVDTRELILISDYICAGLLKEENEDKNDPIVKHT